MSDKDHNNVRRALDWFLSYIGATEWATRKAEMEAHLEKKFPNHLSENVTEMHLPVSTELDTIHWYLYLAENFLTSVEKYEPSQGARIVPVFARLGAELEVLTQVGRVPEKVTELVSNQPHLADSTLFEFLVAILWKRNGWSTVSFVPESASAKTQDLVAQSGSSRWAIECKRLAKQSNYSMRERTKWLKLWGPLSDWLEYHRHSVILDIVFHVELETLHDEFLLDELSGKLPLVATYLSHIVSNDVWDVKVKPVDFERAESHLSEYPREVPL